MEKVSALNNRYVPVIKFLLIFEPCKLLRQLFPTTVCVSCDCSYCTHLALVLVTYSLYHKDKDKDSISLHIMDICFLTPGGQRDYMYCKSLHLFVTRNLQDFKCAEVRNYHSYFYLLCSQIVKHFFNRFCKNFRSF